MRPYSIKHRLEYLGLLLFGTVVRHLPRSLALRIGAALGWLSQHLVPRRKRIVRDNLRRVFPEMPEEELRRNAALIFRHLGKSAVEMLRIDLLHDHENFQGLFEIEGSEHLQAAFGEGQGVFIVTAHLGFWEIGTFLLPYLNCPVDFIAKPIKNPYVDRWFRKLREAGGGRIIESRQAARRIVKSLGEGRCVALLLDQHISPPAGIQVDFLGQPAYTTPIITQIAMKRGVPVVPTFSYRTPDNRYRILFEKPIHFSNEESDAAVQRNTQQLTDRIDAAVRRDITQWLWVHRRWRD